MALTTLEEEFFGEPLTPVERVLAGIPAVLGAVGHLLLASTAVLLLYVLVTAGA
ncbi:MULTISPECIES: hypothetical protein [Halolamina]|uniref:Uncharacterized protein n=1 Tax=Halolamina pelagica TaxID=699431 RepID=A0A1I5PXZ6_9EURY|nr:MULTISPECIES: hypothetical protein [Halolamina]NHX35003.1 hypothetical protein [Halolamina sp. R1-12]SFP38872.1 hypothetical protein SAMN05216277_103160 [Halolamina pelagica]